ncbi:MAG TPA: HAD hydrolase-like protein [Myxococcota bacterium]|nr:HAD hydrolase-like protein [Myxococcota bacterium]HQK51932.1 HAD hydrolase-like protein [Myxococcota bacterium]
MDHRTPIQAAVFDFDGTLVDTMGGFADIAAGILQRMYGLDPQEARRQYLLTSGLPFNQQMEIIRPGDPRNPEAVAEFEATKQEGFFRERFSEDVRKAIRGLRSRGYRCIVSSNNFQHLIDRFVAREADCPFDLVLGAAPGFYKGRDHFLRVQEVFGLRPDQLLFVGDSLKDAEKALANGVAFIARLGTFRREDFEARYPGVRTIESLSQLLDVLP